jgi:hypothetical protein
MTLQYPLDVKDAYTTIRYTWYQASLCATRLKIRAIVSLSFLPQSA